MKHIVKGIEPKSFEDWRRNNHTLLWSDFSGSEVYLELRSTLTCQQNRMCCYCEIALNEDANAHVEHLRNQQNHRGERYDFDNLLASCQYTDSCGHKKGNDYFADMVTPLDNDCQSRFTYTGNGRIIPSDESDTHSQITIDMLGLNCRRLKDRRKSIIKTLEVVHDTDYLQLSLNNCVEWYCGFHTLIEYLINGRN
jgi:uncharacterized protein (TIGR02646 family)